MLRNFRSAFSVAALTSLGCIVQPASGSAATGPGNGYAQVPMGAFSVVAEVRAKPGKEAELRAITLPLIGLVRSDPKNIVYDAHNNMPYVKAWFARLPELAEGGVYAMKMRILAEP